MLPELSPSLQIRPEADCWDGDLLFYTVLKDGHRFAGLMRHPGYWLLALDQGDPLRFSKGQQVVRFLNQLV